MPETSSVKQDSKLDLIIAPEIIENEFYEAIRNLARAADITTVLVIGSSSGEGSIKSWVKGLKENPRKPNLFCMEVSHARCDALASRWKNEGFVEAFLGSSVKLSNFPSSSDVEKFYHTVQGPLNQYPLEEVLGWLKAEIDYLEREAVPTGLINEIKKVKDLTFFDAVLIDGSEFTGSAELDDVYGAKYILLDDTQTYKCHDAHHRLLVDPGYELIAENPNLRNGYSIFRKKQRIALEPLSVDSPVHYFTVVLNGEPFIRHHIEVLKQLSFRWHWHIVEGAADLTHDTSWSFSSGGKLPSDFHKDGLSVDETSIYLDELALQYPDNITIYRKQRELWDGKIEMLSQPLKSIYEDCILWQIDSDELWTVEQLETGRAMFLRSPGKSAAFFWCHFFVGDNKVVISRNCNSQSIKQKCLRAWSYRPGMKWLAHEPPILAERLNNGKWQDLSKGPVFDHAETETLGLVFQHFAYVTEKQMAFKESYYGYTGALENWKKLQGAISLPCRLGGYLPWVKNRVIVDVIHSNGIKPLAAINKDTLSWNFYAHSLTPEFTSQSDSRIVIDGVFFQLNNSGIARVWMEILKIWGASDFGRNIWLLDRNGSAPQIVGINYYSIDAYDTTEPSADSQMLQQICDELKAELFISTYYTTPLTTESVAMVYDMIPELLNQMNNDWQWRDKSLCLSNAIHWISISNNTKHDLLRLNPDIPTSRVSVVPLASSPSLKTPDSVEISKFRERYNLINDYVIVVGNRSGLHVGNQSYKNIELVFKAWTLLPDDEKEYLTILCVGGKPELEAELRLIAPKAPVKMLRLDDSELSLAYAGAVALLYPSILEGFGLPLLEAMACSCPVITCSRSSLTEVAGDAAVFVEPWNAFKMAESIMSLWKDLEMRTRYIDLGLFRSKHFSFEVTAQRMASVLSHITDDKKRGVFCREHHLLKTLRQYQLKDIIHSKLIAEQAGQLNDANRILKVQSEKFDAKRQKLLVDHSSKIKKINKKLEEARSKKRPLKKLWDRLRGR